MDRKIDTYADTFLHDVCLLTPCSFQPQYYYFRNLDLGCLSMCQRVHRSICLHLNQCVHLISHNLSLFLSINLLIICIYTHRGARSMRRKWTTTTARRRLIQNTLQSNVCARDEPLHALFISNSIFYLSVIKISIHLSVYCTYVFIYLSINIITHTQRPIYRNLSINLVSIHLGVPIYVSKYLACTWLCKFLQQYEVGASLLFLPPKRRWNSLK